MSQNVCDSTRISFYQMNNKDERPLSLKIPIYVSGPFSGPLEYLHDKPLETGSRVYVPLGKRTVLGIVADKIESSIKKSINFRSIHQVIDKSPIIDRKTIKLSVFASQYYRGTVGDFIINNLPKHLRLGKPLSLPETLIGKNKIPLYSLSPEQLSAIEQIKYKQENFQPFLLQGITGSGKTQVFQSLIDFMVKNSKQVLLLVPEIGLTNQIIDRILEQLSGNLTISHSGLTDKARSAAYTACLTGGADVLIGTRSALFVPMPRLGLILVDEEHDSAYKNSEGMRYSARDLAVYRAHLTSCKVVLASATPSLESWYNAELLRYKKVVLQKRTAKIPPAQIQLIDSKIDRPKDGLSLAAKKALSNCLSAKEQALVFINRRGFSPMLMCRLCGVSPKCENCDATPTFHKEKFILWCHHCGKRYNAPRTCGNCGTNSLFALGYGTERLEDSLKKNFPDSLIIRVDSDTTQRRNAHKNLLRPVYNGDSCILVGTQILAKGHDFKRLTLVVVVDGDHGIYNTDFRSIERFSQLFQQVSGRAGRKDLFGKVLIQTYFPESMWFPLLIDGKYDIICEKLLRERKTNGWPPLSQIALIRGRGPSIELVMQALTRVKENLTQIKETNNRFRFLGPIPAPMEKKSGLFHGHLLLCGDRKTVSLVLDSGEPWSHKRLGKVFIRLDVDPWDLW